MSSKVLRAAGLAPLLFSCPGEPAKLKPVGSSKDKVLTEKIEEVLASIQLLLSQLSSRSCSKPRAPSCMPCRNGPGCKYFACGACWFAHRDEDSKAVVAKTCMASDITDLTNSLDRNSSNIEKDLSKLRDASAKVEALEKKVNKCCAEMDNKIAKITKHEEQVAPQCDRHLKELAQRVVTTETRVQDIEAGIPSISANAVLETKSYVEKALKKGLEAFFKKMCEQMMRLEKRMGNLESA